MNKVITVTSPLLPPLEEFIPYLEDIWRRKWLTNNGFYHQELEKALCEYLKVPYISLFTNGTLPLICALQAMRITGEVITTPYSFVATTHALWWNGIKPVFVDVDPLTGNMDPEKIEAAITPKTTAVMPVHVYGHACDVETIEKIAKKHNLKVIYDAAHVFGVEVNGRGIGSYGDISMFSFHATKVFNTIEGGALVYNNPELKKQIDSFKNFGIIDQEHVIDIGINSKMNEFQAAMGLCNLRHFDEEIAKREKVYNVYTERLSGVPGITISKTQKGVKPNFAYYPVIFDETVFGKTRDEISEELAKENIFSRKYFYPLISDYDCYRDRFDSKKTPVAKRISNRVLTIPMYANLSVEDANKICDIILKKY